jgi:hypothetical protein
MRRRLFSDVFDDWLVKNDGFLLGHRNREVISEPFLRDEEIILCMWQQESLDDDEVLIKVNAMSEAPAND